MNDQQPTGGPAASWLFWKAHAIAMISSVWPPKLTSSPAVAPFSARAVGETSGVEPVWERERSGGHLAAGCGKL